MEIVDFDDDFAGSADVVGDATGFVDVGRKEEVECLWIRVKNEALARFGSTTKAEVLDILLFAIVVLGFEQFGLASEEVSFATCGIPLEVDGALVLLPLAVLGRTKVLVEDFGIGVTPRHGSFAGFEGKRIDGSKPSEDAVPHLGSEVVLLVEGLGICAVERIDSKSVTPRAGLHPEFGWRGS